MKQDTSIQSYLAPDGLCSLKEGNFPNGSADNDNAILWLGYWVYIASPTIDYNVELTIASLEADVGLYHRNPGRDDSLNSHDNDTAVLALSAYYELDYAEEWVEYGRSTGWHYDNRKHKGTGLREWWRTYRQGSTRFVGKLVAGIKPNAFERIWFNLSVFVNSLQKWNRDGADNSSEWALQWLQLKSLDAINYTAPDYLIIRWWWIRQLLDETGGRGIEAVLERNVSSIKPLIKAAKGVTY